jgi:RNA polymerase sigma factor (sigma-70 family)
MPPQSTETTAGPRRRGFAPRPSRRPVEERNALVVANLNLAYKFAVTRGRRLAPHLADDDRKQAAILGLIRAAEMFDLTREKEFSTTSYYWMHHQIAEAGRTDRLIRVPRSAARDTDALRALGTIVRLDDPGPSGWAQGFDLPARPDDVPGREAVAGLRRAVARLRPDLRAAIEAEMRGETHAEIGRRLGVHRTRVRQRLDQARRRLRADLAPDWRDR